MATTNRKSPSEQRRDEMLEVLATKHLLLTTLETRNSDSLDFSEQAVWSIKAALQEAYELGAQAALAAAAGRR